MEDPIKTTKITQEIEGGRKLYKYEFEIREEPPTPSEPSAEDKPQS